MRIDVLGCPGVHELCGGEDVCACVGFVADGYLLADVGYEGDGVAVYAFFSLDERVDWVDAVVGEVEDRAVLNGHVSYVLQDVGPVDGIAWIC